MIIRFFYYPNSPRANVSDTFTIIMTTIIIENNGFILFGGWDSINDAKVGLNLILKIVFLKKNQRSKLLILFKGKDIVIPPKEGFKNYKLGKSERNRTFVYE